jgi:hypothetical protein
MSTEQHKALRRHEHRTHDRAAAFFATLTEDIRRTECLFLEGLYGPRGGNHRAKRLALDAHYRKGVPPV